MSDSDVSAPEIPMRRRIILGSLVLVILLAAESVRPQLADPVDAASSYNFPAAALEVDQVAAAILSKGARFRR